MWAACVCGEGGASELSVGIVQEGQAGYTIVLDDVFVVVWITPSILRCGVSDGIVS
jgi:hypothetical protein